MADTNFRIQPQYLLTFGGKRYLIYGGRVSIDKGQDGPLETILEGSEEEAGVLWHLSEIDPRFFHELRRLEYFSFNTARALAKVEMAHER